MSVAEKIGVGASGGGASNIFDVFTTGEAPYTGIRASYRGADADWSARGVAIVPAVKSSALLPISGSMVDGWSFTFKSSYISAADGADGWKLIRRERADAAAAVAASVRWEYQTGQFVTITAVTAGAAGNNIGIKIDPAAQPTHQTEFAVSRAGTRFDITYRTRGETISQFITAANTHFTRIVFSLDAGGTSSNNITRSLPIIGAGYARMTGGVDAISAEPISLDIYSDTKELIVNIKTTDTLATIRGSSDFHNNFSAFAEVTVVGTVDQATATFAIPANDPGIVFAGGKDGNPLGVEIDELLKIIDVRYDPSAHTLGNIFGVMETAGVSPEYRGGGAAGNSPEVLGWVRSVGPLTAASPGTGTTVGSALSAAQIKQRYESNANTNAFTNALQTKVNGVDVGAKDDQTGAEIKAAYEGEADTNVYTNDEKAKLGGVATGATAVSITNVLEKILEGTGVVIDRTTGGQITVASTGGVSLPVVSLGAAAIEARGLTFAEPAGYPSAGYSKGTLLSFNIGYYTAFVSSTNSINIIIGTDAYSFYLPNTGTVRYSSLITDTHYLLIVASSNTLQILAPIKSAAATSTTTTAITDNSITPAQLKAKSAAEKAAMTTRIAAAALTGAVFTGAVKGINPSEAKDFVTLEYFNAHRNVAPITDDLYFGVSDDAIPISTELTILGVKGIGVIPAFSGEKHLIIARLASEGDIASVTFSIDSTNTNQVGVFDKYANTLVPPTKSEAYTIWVTEDPVTNAAGVTVTVR